MSPEPNPFPESAASRWAAAAVCLLGLAAVGASALQLGAYGSAHHLTSDFLTPYFFCGDLVAGRYPLSGWTLSASPYFVPDHLGLSGLFAVLGRSGFSYSLYPMLFYPALFILAGLCVKTAVGRTAPALLGTLLFGSGFLALRALPGWHALWLWWLGAPCCHGGLLLVGLAYLWMLGTGLRRGRIGYLPVGMFLLGLIGLVSDTLFLFQILLPASVSLFICRRYSPEFARLLRWQGGCFLASLACAQLFKPVCYLVGWFYFCRIIRVSPTPSHQWHALKQFLSDLPDLWSHGWGFALLAAVAASWSWYSARAWRRAGAVTATSTHGIHPGVLRFYRLQGLASLLLMLPLPIAACSWKNPTEIRYLFNWLVLPGFLLTLEATAWLLSRDRTSFGHRSWHRALAGSAVVFLVCLVGAVMGLCRVPPAFPYPENVAALDELLQRHHLKYGLAQYWNAKYVTALTHSGAELRQIRANTELYFWDNNAFGYYERAPAGTFSWPRYQYILVNQLDESAVARVFGEPSTKEEAGGFQIWIYGEDGLQRIRNVLEPAVRTKLGPQRLPLLSQTAVHD